MYFSAIFRFRRFKIVMFDVLVDIVEHIHFQGILTLKKGRFQNYLFWASKVSIPTKSTIPNLKMILFFT